MYEESLAQRLTDIDAEPGDTVSVRTRTDTLTGTLMPRSKQGRPDALVIKLENGYNIGIREERIDSIDIEEKKDREEDKEIQERSKEDNDVDIAILHTGGTIASRVSYVEGGVKPAFNADDLLEMYPELFEMATVETDVVAQMLSEDMEPDHWQQIAKTVAEYREKDGVIIGHGTDTMHFTASALSFMLAGIDFPVVLVGAQRSSDRPSSDAAMNLIAAVEFIKEAIPGVYICMHGESSDRTAAIHKGTQARKLHTSRRDAIKTVGGEPFARVDYEKGSVDVNKNKRTTEKSFELRTALETDVSLFKTVPGMTQEQLEPYENSKGLVIEGTGLGHMPVNSFDEHTQHHEEILAKVGSIAAEGVVVMTSQCLNGTVNMNVYDAGVKLQHHGIIEANDMLPETAYVKLMWCLGQAESRQEAISLFKQNIADEIKSRRTYEDNI